MSVITFSTDDETDRALAELTADGHSASAAIRAAILHAARTKEDALTLAQARAVASDPEDLAEMEAVMRDMDGLRAW